MNTFKVSLERGVADKDLIVCWYFANIILRVY